jgi:sulfite reductase (ferredoxin)
VEATNFWRGTVACTGTEFCKLAITETKGFARWLVEEMEGRMPGFDQQIKLHVTGCPNSCGQHWIADVGLEGKKIKQDGKLADAWSFALGGALGVHAGVARLVNYRCLSEDVPDALERLLRNYLGTRAEEQNLRAWFAGNPTTSCVESRGLHAGGSLSACRDLGYLPMNRQEMLASATRAE